MVALADLLAERSLGLELVAGADSADRDIAAAAVSELVNPGPWLQGGELLMTIGLLIPMNEQACRDYIGRVHEVGVRALGLGLGADLPHQSAPEVLRAAADRAGMPLLTVPDGVPFIAVTKAVFAFQAAEERRELEWAVGAQRALTDAAVQSGGLDAILTAHYRATECAGVVTDPMGRVLAAAGCDGDALADRLTDLVESIRGRGLSGAAVHSSGGLRKEVHPLGSRRLRAWLLIDGRADRVTSQFVTAGLVSLLSLELERRQAVDGAERRRRAQVFDRLTRPDVDDVMAARLLASVGLADGPRRCAAVSSPDDPEGLASDLGAALPDTIARAVGDIVEVAAPSSANLSAALQRLASGKPTGIGGSFEPSSLEVAVRQARSALAASRSLGRPVSADELAGQDALAMLPGDIVSAYADAVLGPLDAADAKGELRSTLAAFLTGNGSWEVAAQSLGVHRQTVRNRIARIEQITGRELNSAQNRLELSLALYARSGRA